VIGFAAVVGVLLGQVRGCGSHRPDRPPAVQSLTKGTQTVYLDYDATGTPQVFTTDTGVENFYVFDGTIGLNRPGMSGDSFG
jgi:hypothetical protein